MRKLFSELIGQPVTTRDSAKPVARVFDLVLDPANGGFIALSVHPALQQVVGARDIVSWTPQITIRDLESIIEPSEVVRIQRVLNTNTAFLYNRVETESGVYLGRVHDYLMDITAGALLKIMVSKSFLGIIRWNERIIPMSEIIRVEPERVIVKDDLLMQRVAKPERVMAGA